MNEPAEEKLRLKTTDELIQVIVDLNTHLSERESVIAKLRDEVKEANIGEFDAMLRENDFKERFYAKCKETEALKSKLGEAEKYIAELMDFTKKMEILAQALPPNAISMNIGKALSSLRPKTSGSDGEGGEGKS